MVEVERSAQDIADHIRGSQIHAMEANVPKSVVGFLGAAVPASLVAVSEWGWLLAVWLPVLVVACGARLALALKTTMAPVRPMGVEAERRLMVAGALVSLAMALGPTWIALNSEGVTSAIMIMVAISALWGGAVVQAPLFSSAVCYATANIPVWLTCLVLSDHSSGRLWLGALFIVNVGVALDNVKRYARAFEAGERQKLDLLQQSDRLRQQADVIGLLLKDHEDQSSDWLWRTDRTGRVEQPSSRFVEVFAPSGHVLEGAVLIDLFAAPQVAGNDDALRQLREHTSAGRSFRDLVIPGALAGRPHWWSISGRAITDPHGGGLGYRGVMADITVAHQAQAHVAYLAHHDALTGLSNRVDFCARVQPYLDLGDQRRVALISIDLDGFKPINDRFGHPIGDALLTALAGRLITLTSGLGAAARLGGDEFAIAVFDADPGRLEGLCKRLIETLSAPQRIDAHDIMVGASIGVAVAPTDGRTVQDLLKNADAALYRAKREGRGQYRFFDAEMDRQIQVRLALLQDLRESIPRGQLSLHYQPFIDSQNGAVTGFEALLRWKHPQRGMVSPAEFIPIAEESGLIGDIGRWVLENACQTAAGWPGHVRVSVNVSPRQFKDTSLPAFIAAVLERTGLAAQRLEVEVTEAVLIDDAAGALEILKRIRAIGVRLALDDFGTGYSSLSYMRDFPFDKLKIDRSFVRDLEQREDSQVIVQGIRSIALGLGMTITAEGVETVGQAQRLRSSGCHELQGFLFSKAQPDTEVPELLLQRHLFEESEAEGEAIDRGAGTVVNPVADKVSSPVAKPVTNRREPVNEQSAV